MSRFVLIELREEGAESPVDKAEHNGVRHTLDKDAGARRKGQENSRSKDDEENHGDEDVCVEGGHL